MSLPMLDMQELKKGVASNPWLRVDVRVPGTENHEL